jgi:hypothetical protein
MRLVEDFTHPAPHDGRCRVRIYTDDELPVVICTEARDNPDQSIRNAAEQIAAEVMTNHPEIFDPFVVSPLPGVTYDKPFSSGSNTTRTERGGPQRIGRRST